MAIETDRRPRVAMLVRNPYTHDSRVEKEADTLREAGFDVTVVAEAGPGLPAIERRDGTDVIRVARAASRLPGVRFVMNDRRMLRALVDLAPDILHAHDSNALLAVGLAARHLGRPFIYDAHELWLHRPRRGHARVYHDASRAYYAGLQRWLVPRAAAVITVSEPIADHLRRTYPGIDGCPCSQLSRSSAASALRHRCASSLDPRLSPDAPIVLHLGGAMATRGLDHLVTAMVDVPTAHLAFVGGGDVAPLHGLAERLGIADRVHAAPPVPPAEVEAYAAAADIGVVTTLPIGLNNRYSLPNKLFQYMAAGIPVVASDFPQIREVVVGSGAGLVVDTRDPSRIATALNELLTDRDRSRAMGLAGRRAIEDRFNWSAAAEVLLDVYSRVRSLRSS